MKKFMMVWDRSGKISKFYEHMEQIHSMKESFNRIKSGEFTVSQEAHRIKGVIMEASTKGKALAFDLGKTLGDTERQEILGQLF